MTNEAYAAMKLQSTVKQQKLVDEMLDDLLTIEQNHSKNLILKSLLDCKSSTTYEDLVPLESLSHLVDDNNHEANCDFNVKSDSMPNLVTNAKDDYRPPVKLVKYSQLLNTGNNLHTSKTFECSSLSDPQPSVLKSMLHVNDRLVEEVYSVEINGQSSTAMDDSIMCISQDLQLDSSMSTELDNNVSNTNFGVSRSNENLLLLNSENKKLVIDHHDLDELLLEANTKAAETDVLGPTCSKSDLLLSHSSNSKIKLKPKEGPETQLTVVGTIIDHHNTKHVKCTPDVVRSDKVEDRDSSKDFYSSQETSQQNEESGNNLLDKYKTEERKNYIKYIKEKHNVTTIDGTAPKYSHDNVTQKGNSSKCEQVSKNTDIRNNSKTLISKKKPKTHIGEDTVDSDSEDVIVVDDDDSCDESFEKSDDGKFLTYQDMASHMVPPKDFCKSKRVSKICDICSQSFSCGANVRRHKKNVHKIPSTPPKPVFECDKCDKRFSTAFSLKIHDGVYHKETKGMCSCEMCGQMFVLYSNLTKHKRTVHGDTGDTERPFQCDYCEKCFSFRFELKRHSFFTHYVK